LERNARLEGARADAPAKRRATSFILGSFLRGKGAR